MIVVDTSALIAILKNEPPAADCQAILLNTDVSRISAATLTEARIVCLRQNRQNDLENLFKAANLDIIDVTPSRAERAAAAYARWGKGFHPAGLNFGDCFSYALADELDCPLLFIGNDFARTDIRSALAS
ncbi:type II toxin-antitoxin system VapC family toxin [Rhizobium sp. 18065]|uniref:type II toxin-antitoxin system VapC family toxin n=1 Tax=Rhizobium sp. 18065 TaxID=2681411 RepID=UPI00135C7568|nr:type II toxin-antitoxin system VapC family toxin [Rhizobium sp. 18065]